MRILGIVCAAALTLHGLSTASAEQLTLVVGFAPGGTSSTAARFIAEALERTSGSTVIVENKPGAGGLLAALWVKQQKRADTLLFMSATSLMRVPPDFGLVPIGMVASYPFVVLVSTGAPKTLSDYMGAVRGDDSLRNVATAGAGSVAHLIGAKLFRDHGLVMEHIPYASSLDAVNAVRGHQVAMAIVPLPDFPHSEEFRMLARTGSGVETGGWIGIFAAPGTSPSEVTRLSALLREASVKSKTKLESVGFLQEWQPAETLARRYASDHERLKPIADGLGIKF